MKNSKLVKTVKGLLKKILCLKLYASGLSDCFKVIENGDTPKHRAVQDDKYPNFKASYYGIFKEMYKQFKIKKVSAIKIDYRELVYLGHTANNIKEFEFFYKICKTNLTTYDFPCEYNNISLLNKKGKRKHNTFLNLVFPFIAVVIFFVYRVKINKTSFHYAMQYTEYFLFYFLNFYPQRVLLPKIAVLANDHTPQYLAASKVLKFFNVNRIYLQHGAVSNLFPKLDFEVSVLWNDKSKDIYGSSKREQSVLTISRDLNPSRNPISQVDNTKNTVFVFLTSIFNPDNLNILISKLNSINSINKVFIQPHPRSKDLDLIKGNFELIKDYNEYLGAFNSIVGNSSIALELILKGRVVYQCFDFDDIIDDYYGFVSDNLACTLKIDDIHNQFTFPSFTVKKESLHKYCPKLSGVHESHIELLNNIIKKEFEKSVRKGALPLNVFEQLNKKIEKDQSLLYEFSCLYEHDGKYLDLLIQEGALSIEEKLLFEKKYG